MGKRGSGWVASTSSTGSAPTEAPVASQILHGTQISVIKEKSF